MTNLTNPASSQEPTSAPSGGTTTEAVAIIELGREAIAAFSRQSQVNLETTNKQVELQREQLQLYSSFVSKIYWLVVLALVCIVSIAAGVIFHLKDLRSGLTILGLTGTVVTGFLAGIGWKSRSH